MYQISDNNMYQISDNNLYQKAVIFINDKRYKIMIMKNIFFLEGGGGDFFERIN